MRVGIWRAAVRTIDKVCLRQRISGRIAGHGFGQVSAEPSIVVIQEKRLNSQFDLQFG